MPAACDQALWGALAAGREKEGELATTALWNLNSTPNSPVDPRRLSCQIFANQGEAETSANVNKHVLRVMTSMPISSSPISISHRLFRCRYSNSRKVVASSPSFSRPPPEWPKELARKLRCQVLTDHPLPEWALDCCVHTFSINSEAIHCFAYDNLLLPPTFQNCVWQGQMQQFSRKLHRVPKVWTPFLWCEYPGP